MNINGLHAAAHRVASSLGPASATSTAAAASSKAKATASTTNATGATAGAGTSASTATADSGDITANDFLTLLVTEMQNQDPTQPTDPNAYIQQLVSVNSLQQLISINNDLTSPATTAASGTGSSVGGISGVSAAAPGTTSSATGVAATAATSALGTSIFSPDSQTNSIF